MKKFWMLALLATVLTMTGCASTRSSAGPSVDMEFDESKIIKPVIPFEVKSDIREANRRYEQGDTEEALWLYEKAINQTPQADSTFRSAVLTNAALACLQMGDREKFIYLSNQLQVASRELSPIPKNTQVVLVLREVFSGQNKGRDMRISSGLKEAVYSALGEGER